MSKPKIFRIKFSTLPEKNLKNSTALVFLKQLSIQHGMRVVLSEQKKIFGSSINVLFASLSILSYILKSYGISKGMPLLPA
jgi:hypothetical protein